MANVKVHLMTRRGNVNICPYALEIFCHVDCVICILFWREMTSRHLTLRQPECNLAGNDVTSPLATDSQHQSYCKNGCHLADYIVSNILMKAHGRKFDKE